MYPTLAVALPLHRASAFPSRFWVCPFPFALAPSNGRAIPSLLLYRCGKGRDSGGSPLVQKILLLPRVQASGLDVCGGTPAITAVESQRPEAWET